MATELSIETNAKKIQTLTKVAKLLRDQIQEQNKKIESLQLEILNIKEKLERIPPLSTSPFPQSEESTSSVIKPSIQPQPFQKEVQIPEIEKFQERSPAIGLTEKSKDDKEQLLKALKVIDEL
ncbi:MAG: hypothetical protein JSW11_06375 [Candidatus Heimdallarchaeota archaeon]|nr:MAG: hypothetical protein JSW11_06375 [Candidatus Heimdallarchaeota archaeon]